MKYGSRLTPTMETLDHDLYQLLDEFSLGLLPPLRVEEDEVELLSVSYINRRVHLFVLKGTKLFHKHINRRVHLFVLKG